MLNVLWGGMVFLGVVWGIASGNTELLTEGILNGAGDAVSLCITMAGILAFWCGIMEIAGQAGLLKKLTGALKPFVGFLFPEIPENHPARDAVSANLAANILGLGWAATPAGLEAMKQLEELEETRRRENGEEQEKKRHFRREGSGAEMKETQSREAGTDQEKRMYLKKKEVKNRRLARKTESVPRGTASREMCTFLILNISSLQLIPVNMIAYRSRYGSAMPEVIVGPAILVTLASTAAAVVFCRVMDRRGTRRSKSPER